MNASDRIPARLRIFAADGRLIRRLVDHPLPAGTYEIAWGGRSDGGVRVAAGIHFGRFDAAGRTRVHKIVISS